MPVTHLLIFPHPGTDLELGIWGQIPPESHPVSSSFLHSQGPCCFGGGWAGFQNPHKNHLSHLMGYIAYEAPPGPPSRLRPGTSVILHC